MKKVIMMALVFAGLTTAGYAQSTQSVKKANTPKTSVVQKHKKMPEQKTATIQQDNKKAVNATNKTSSVASHSAGTAWKSKQEVKKSTSSKMSTNGTRLDSTHAYKKNSKMHQ